MFHKDTWYDGRIAGGCIVVGTDFCEKNGMMIGEYLSVACLYHLPHIDGHNDGHTHGAYHAYLYDCPLHALFMR